MLSVQNLGALTYVKAFAGERPYKRPVCGKPPVPVRRSSSGLISGGPDKGGA